MNNTRKGLDLYFSNYIRKSRTRFTTPAVLAIMLALFGILFQYDLLQIGIPVAISYALYSVGGFFAIIAILGFIFGKDKSEIASDVHVASFLAEDISSVRNTMKTELPSDFSFNSDKTFLVINHCHFEIDGFIPYFRKGRDGVLRCSINKLTFFVFGEQRLHIFSSIIDLLTGIEIRQHSISIPYSSIYDCYISFVSNLKQNSVVFKKNTSGKGVERELQNATKACKDVLRIKIENKENSNFSSLDIVVSDYEIIYQESNTYKVIHTLNEGKQLEQELLSHIDKTKSVEKNTKKIEQSEVFNFVDEQNSKKDDAPPNKLVWN